MRRCGVRDGVRLLDFIHGVVLQVVGFVLDHAWLARVSKIHARLNGRLERRHHLSVFGSCAVQHTCASAVKGSALSAGRHAQF